jgi:Fuc2NAc and GlcNAc transferase
MLQSISLANLQFAQFAILLFVTCASLYGTYLYRGIAGRHEIVAKINSRSLHSRLVPRGGGIAFAVVFAVSVIVVWGFGGLPTWLMLCLGVGGGAAALLGFVDDVRDIRATWKLLAQLCLAVWVFAIFSVFLKAPAVSDYTGTLLFPLALTSLFISVWFINLYNFMDGVDGMAISGAVFICFAAIVVLAISDGERYFILVFALLAASCLGFLFFNLPPASIFMGDAGSIFLGYSLGTLLLSTVVLEQIGIWTWIAILGYFIGDTTTTGLYRLFRVKKWYGVHRSHAYQNVARIYNSHARATYGVLLYQLLWSLPLAIWSVTIPSMGPFAATLSLVPAVAWTLRFGPGLSSD